MEIILREEYDSLWIDQMINIYNKTEMKRNNKEKVDRAFLASYAVASCWLGDKLVGIGRIVSDGMYSSIYDLVIDPEFQKMGLGKTIMNNLISKAPDTCIHLTSTFGNEMFYIKLGFKRHKTALALYPKNSKPSSYLDYEWPPNN
ncbi:MAG: GNAT family N-acetyltransferase [Bacteriovorax sp.]